MSAFEALQEISMGEGDCKNIVLLDEVISLQQTLTQIQSAINDKLSLVNEKDLQVFEQFKVNVLD